MEKLNLHYCDFNLGIVGRKNKSRQVGTSCAKRTVD